MYGDLCIVYSMYTLYEPTVHIHPSVLFCMYIECVFYIMYSMFNNYFVYTMYCTL